MVEKITQPLTPLENTEKINEIIDNFADKNLSNLSASGQQILDDKLDTQMITNCITEIPQDIKLELNNGTLTLKAGSKVTYLDESTQIIASDVSTTGISFTGECFVFYNNGVLNVRAISQVSSGTSTPTSAVSGKNLYFNTSTKKVYSYTNNQWVEIAFSLPLGIITLQASSPYIKSFDKTFNGFGYFGSTVFALPGVKGLVPSGRNEDGTLRNTEIVNNSVKTTTTNYTISDGLVVLTAGGIYEISTTTWNYNKEKNIYENSSGEKSNHIVLASASYTNGVISNFRPKLPFRAVDHSDSSWIAEQAMISNKYIGLSLGVSGASYTAPASGCFVLTKASTAVNQYINIANQKNSKISQEYSVTSGQNLRVFLNVSKGDVVTVNYTAAGTASLFRFIYSNGDV